MWEDTVVRFIRALFLSLMPIFLGYAFYLEFPEQLKYAWPMGLVQLVNFGFYQFLIYFTIIYMLLRDLKK